MHLFAGAGGGILADIALGHVPVCAVEFDDYARRVLLARQRDGCLPRFAVWDDVRTFDGKPWRGYVDIVAGGFPCQDISAAGNGAGIEGGRSGLWFEMARVIGEVRPRYAFVENSPVLTSRGLGRVLGDLAAMGYDARWGVHGAYETGAPHKRNRIWIVATDADRVRKLQPQRGEQEKRGWAGDCGADVADADSQPRHEWRARDASQKQGRRDADRGHIYADVCGADSTGLEERQGQPSDDGSQQPTAIRSNWWKSEPAICGVDYGMASALDIHRAASTGYLGRVVAGVPNRVARLKCLGNGQVPACAMRAWESLI